MDDFVRQKTSQGTAYTHEYLWHVSGFALENAGRDIEGRDLNFLFAFLTTFLAFEAYINFLTEKVFTNKWHEIQNSRIEFKIDLLNNELILNLDKNSVDYRKFVEARALRNKISHPKVHRWSKTEALSDGAPEKTLPSFPLPWDEIHNTSQINEFRKSLEILANSLHSEISKNHPNIDLEGLNSAFSGIMARSNSVTKSVPKPL